MDLEYVSKIVPMHLITNLFYTFFFKIILLFEQQNEVSDCNLISRLFINVIYSVPGAGVPQGTGDFQFRRTVSGFFSPRSHFFSHAPSSNKSFIQELLN